MFTLSVKGQNFNCGKTALKGEEQFRCFTRDLCRYILGLKKIYTITLYTKANENKDLLIEKFVSGIKDIMAGCTQAEISNIFNNINIYVNNNLVRRATGLWVV